MPKTEIEVTFSSEFIDTSVKLFCSAFDLDASKQLMTNIEFSSNLNSERYNIRDIRSWLASALECGLIYTGSCIEF